MTVAGELVRLRKAKLSVLAARYRELTGEDLKSKDHDAAWRAVARALQGQPAAAPIVAMRPERAAPNPRRRAKPAKRRSTPRRPAVGTVLVRYWRNQEIRVRVLETGFEWDGKVFRSLSGAAKAITGAHWRGPLFFQLVDRKGKAKR